jgi:hypothetical protein
MTRDSCERCLETGHRWSRGDSNPRPPARNEVAATGGPAVAQVKHGAGCSVNDRDSPWVTVLTGTWRARAGLLAESSDHHPSEVVRPCGSQRDSQADRPRWQWWWFSRACAVCGPSRLPPGRSASRPAALSKIIPRISRACDTKRMARTSQRFVSSARPSGALRCGDLLCQFRLTNQRMSV